MCTDESGTKRQTAFIKKINRVSFDFTWTWSKIYECRLDADQAIRHLDIFTLLTSSFFMSDKTADLMCTLHWMGDVIESRSRWRPLWAGCGDPSRVSIEAEGWPWLTEALSEREKRAQVNRDTMECRERRENGFLIGLGVLELSSLYAQRERIYHQPLIDCV